MLILFLFHSEIYSAPDIAVGVSYGIPIKESSESDAYLTLKNQIVICPAVIFENGIYTGLSVNAFIGKGRMKNKPEAIYHESDISLEILGGYQYSKSRFKLQLILGGGFNLAAYIKGEGGYFPYTHPYFSFSIKPHYSLLPKLNIAPLYRFQLLPKNFFSTSFYNTFGISLEYLVKW